VKTIREVSVTTGAPSLSRSLRQGGDFDSSVKSYNSRMCQIPSLVLIGLAVLTSSTFAQQSQPAKPTSNVPIALPKASLWNRYSFQFQATGDHGPYRWRVVNGVFPRGVNLREDGELSGEIVEQGQSNFTIAEIDRGGEQKQQNCVLATETPLATLWSKHAEVNGQRIDGSIKVSNNTGRDFDLTFVVLAVNDIGRATAIGYQHFPLKQNTKDLEIPFGDTLSSGNYIVNVDVVGEEPQSNMIFRSRLVSGKEAITQGP
jgi:hypothetical protein